MIAMVNINLVDYSELMLLVHVVFDALAVGLLPRSIDTGVRNLDLEFHSSAVFDLRQPNG
jgi:hypothetical protein